MNKLPKGEYPNGASPEDFECFGPPATKDGEFGGTRICDMGCFKQDGTDSNKFYHAAVVKHKKTGCWYAYFEWGRTGSQNPDCQFVECSGESDAQAAYEEQLHSKNDKRGEWTTLAGIKTLGAKPGKDCYLVRPQATRATGLPDAKTIQMNDGAKPKAQAAVPTAKAKTASKGPSVDPQTARLMHDLNLGTVSFAKSAMASASLPTQAVIDEGRTVLTEALKEIKRIGNSVDAQAHDKQLLKLTNFLYSKIQKKKPVGAAVDTWVLSQGNIFAWQQDLDAFEAALQTSVTDAVVDSNPLAGMGLEMEWIDSRGTYEWLFNWAPRATKNVHGYLGNMRIHNAWRVLRPGEHKRFEGCQDRLAREAAARRETALFQTKNRGDVSSERSKPHYGSNTSMLFHGTRSVNVSGILRTSLRMPNQLRGVVITGAMFGPGAYFADDWKKSAGYTSIDKSYWSGGGGGVRSRQAFMFIVDVALGNPWVAPHSGGYTYEDLPRGFHSCFGMAGRSGVQNNEFIVYKTDQYSLRYLLEFSA